MTGGGWGNQEAEEMRDAVFRVCIALMGGSLSLFMVSCEDKQSQPPPQEFDRQIDSIAAAPLPVINPDMIEQASGGPDESSMRFREPGGMESDRAPDTEAGLDEGVDTPSPIGPPADPNNI